MQTFSPQMLRYVTFAASGTPWKSDQNQRNKHKNNFMKMKTVQCYSTLFYSQLITSTQFRCICKQ